MTSPGPSRHRPALLQDERGVVYLELLIAFVPMWMVFLCTLQLAFIAHADLLVKHAADAAARSAAVVLPDDPDEYGGEPAMTVDRNPVTGREIESALRRLGSVAADRVDETALRSALSDRALLNLGRSRLNTIRMAAHVPLMPLAPLDVGPDSETSVAKAIGHARRLVSALYYQPFAVAVTFPGLDGTRVDGPEITVRVTYAYQCTVPLGRRFLCGELDSLEHADDLDDAFFPAARQLVGGRFRSIQHETTLLVHDAPYQYRARRS